VKKYLIPLLKITIPLIIIAVLLFRVQQNDPRIFADLQAREKDWGVLAIAFLLAMGAVSTTFIRWYLLVRSLGMAFRLRDAFRLGALGFLMNFVSLGATGGDFFKAFFLAREQPARKTEAVATVVVDRIIGLYAVFVVASVAILFSSEVGAGPRIAAFANGTLTATAIGGVGFVIMLLPGFSTGPISEFLCGLPKIGSMIEKLIGAFRIYRRQPGLLVGISLLSLLVHGLSCVSFYLVSQALFDGGLTLAQHFFVVPIAIVAGAMPFTPAGLGVMEYMLDFLYAHFPGSTAVAGQGLVVALAYRVITIVIALAGVVFYWTARREMNEVLHEVEAEAAEQAAAS